MSYVRLSGSSVSKSKACLYVKDQQLPLHLTFVSMEASLRPVSKLLNTVVTASISMSDSSRLLSVLMFAQEQDMFPLSPTHTRLILSTEQNVIIAAT